MNGKGVVFIDANQYLDLYRTVDGEKLLALIEKQQANILVTSQVVKEVQRQKVKVTASFLGDSVGEPEPKRAARPNRLSRTDVALRERIHQRLQKIRKKISHDLLEQVSQSKDGVSKALAGVFSKAVEPTDEELQRARARRERGEPPGKQRDALGDQISWEQILSRCGDKPKLWMITRDSDYGTVHAGEMFLNAALYQELVSLYHAEPVVFCFDNILEGLTHFALTTGAKAEELPTPAEIAQAKKEQESLPPLVDYDDSGQISIRIHESFRLRDSMQLRAALAAQINSEVVVPPPPAAGTDESAPKEPTK